jgi:hypothetical protein
VESALFRATARRPLEPDRDGGGVRAALLPRAIRAARDAGDVARRFVVQRSDTTISRAHERHHHTIAFDIEVAGYPWRKIDEITRGYLLSARARRQGSRGGARSHGTHAGLGKIIAIGMWA